MINIEFLSDEHKKRFYQCLHKDKTYQGDRERFALFYILTGCDELWEKNIINFYDFEKQLIKSRFKVDLSSGSKAMVKLAFHLYNDNNKLFQNSIVYTFNSLDEANTKLAINAITIRFK